MVGQQGHGHKWATDLLTFMSNVIFKSGQQIFGMLKPSQFKVPGWNERAKELNARYRDRYYQYLFLIYLLIGCICCRLFVAMSNQILVQVLTVGSGFSFPTFVVFMPILRLWLQLGRIMIFWFVLSPKSLIATISQSFVSLALVTLTEAVEPGCGSVC